MIDTTEPTPFPTMRIRESDRTIDVLMALRPALDGFYGIPQETRLMLSARGA